MIYWFGNATSSTVVKHFHCKLACMELFFQKMFMCGTVTEIKKKMPQCLSVSLHNAWPKPLGFDNLMHLTLTAQWPRLKKNASFPEFCGSCNLLLMNLSLSLRDKAYNFNQLSSFPTPRKYMVFKIIMRSISLDMIQRL